MWCPYSLRSGRVQEWCQTSQGIDFRKSAPAELKKLHRSLILGCKKQRPYHGFLVPPGKSMWAALAMLACSGAMAAYGIGRSLWLDEVWVANSLREPSLGGMFHYP